MSKVGEEKVLLAMSAPPFWHCGRTVQRASLHTILALLPALAMGIFYNGIPALRVVCLSVVVAMLSEALSQKIMERDIELSDGTAVVAGMFFAFLLPATVPWWLVVLGSSLSIFLGKMAFGGYGTNPVCTCLVGWALLEVSFPSLMDPNSMLLNTVFTDPLVHLKYFGATAAEYYSHMDLLFGRQIGGLGSAQILPLFLGGTYLVARGIIRWEIVVAFLGGALFTAGAFNIANPSLYVNPFFHILTGSTVFGAFFLATESSCSPSRPLAMILYGLTGGCLAIISRLFSIHVDAVPYAILFVNLLAPYFELIRPKPFGVKV